MRFDENTKLDYVLLLDELPTLYEERFQMIVHRASTLVNLPENNIHLFNDAASSLFSLFSTEFSDHYKPTKEHGNPETIFFSNAEFLYKNLGLLAKLNFNLSDSQYFGLLALSMVEEAMFLESYMPTKQHQHDWGQEDEVLVCLTSAFEAICFGEALAPIRSSFSSTIEAEVKRRAQRGADKRYERIRKLKNNFLRYRDNQGANVSNAKSARKYFQSLCEEDKRILCHTLIEANAVRTLTDYLRKYQKQINPK